MSETTSAPPARSYTASMAQPGQAVQPNLADILERVLDKGIVIAGDIRINLLDIELLTIRIRLLVASVDKAQEMGIDWWRRDPTLSGDTDLAVENKELRQRLEALEADRQNTENDRTTAESGDA